MDISRFALNYLRGESLQWPVFMSRSASLYGAEEKCFRGLRKMRWRKEELKSVKLTELWCLLRVHMQVCVCIKKRRQQYSAHREGRNIVPPFLLLSTEQLCVSMAGWRAWKKGRNWYDILTLPRLLFASHRDVWILTDSCQVSSS